MADDTQLKKFLAALGLEAFAAQVPENVVRELETVLGELGGAEELLAGRAPPPPPPQPNPAFAIPDPPIAPGRVQYACSDDESGTVTPVPPIDVSTEAGVFEGTISWGIKVLAVDGPLPFGEGVIMRAADLRLISHDGGTRLFNFKSAVVGEYVYTRTSLPGSRSRPRVRLPESAFASLPSLWAALAAAPLDGGWHASVHLLRKVASDDWRYVPLTLHVSGEERVSTRAGTFDCWIVSARGTLGECIVDDRYWVSRGDAGARVVVRGHERLLGGATRRYELAVLVREPDGSEAAPAAAGPPPAASFELEIDGSRREFDRVRMRRPSTTLPTERVREALEKEMERVPPIEVLRAAGKIPPGTSAEAIARYERERAEYEQDVRARIAMYDLWVDHGARRVRARAIVRVESDEPRQTHVRLTVPSRLAMELPGEKYSIEQVQPPRPLSAPLDERRKGFVQRLRFERERFANDYPSEKFVAPDGSNVIVFGPVAMSRATPMEINVTFAFATWEDVAPFTLMYDVSAAGMESLTGSVPIDVFIAERKS